MRCISRAWALLIGSLNPHPITVIYTFARRIRTLNTSSQAAQVAVTESTIEPRSWMHEQALDAGGVRTTRRLDELSVRTDEIYRRTLYAALTMVTTRTTVIGAGLCVCRRVSVRGEPHTFKSDVVICLVLPVQAPPVVGRVRTSHRPVRGQSEFDQDVLVRLVRGVLPLHDPMMNVVENGKVGEGVVDVFEPSILVFRSGTEAELGLMAKCNGARVASGVIFNVHTPMEGPPAAIDGPRAWAGLSQENPVHVFEVLGLIGPWRMVRVRDRHLHVPDLTA